MVRTFINRKLDAVQKELGVPVPEARYMAEHALGALWAFSKTSEWTRRRQALPADVYYIAKIGAYRQEDCGSCLQIAINQARREGVPAQTIRAAVDGRVESLPPELRLAYRFAEGQANRQDDAGAREEVIRRWGHEGLIELALAIASARMYPALKRTLGFATSCSMVKVAI